jgi:hypothetical protein
MAWNNPTTWVAGDPLTAAELNSQVRDNMKAIGDAWMAYTPTWTAVTTNPVLGNGTIAGAYSLAGKLIHWRLRLVMGSTTTYGSGNYLFSLPVVAVGAAQHPVGLATILNGAARLGHANLNSTTAVYVARTANDTLISSAGAGAAWASGHIVDINGTYEAA